jgi:curved DNA-binding protein CbpA
MMNSKIESALRLFGLLNCDVNNEVVKKAYRKACSKYHPDKGGSNEMMKAVNDAYDLLKDFKGSSKETENQNVFEEDNYPDELNDALNAALALDGLFVEVCGIWVWVTGETMKHKEALKEAGFKWAKKKKAWHFRPSDYKSKGRGSWDLDKIREEHGSRSFQQKSRRKLKAA